MHHNEIEKIDARSFESLSNLKWLHLNNNKLKEIDRKCSEPLKSIEMILLNENVGLNAVSLLKPSTPEYKYDEDQENEYGSITDWNKFLQQFPTQLGNYNYSSIYH